MNEILAKLNFYIAEGWARGEFDGSLCPEGMKVWLEETPSRHDSKQLRNCAAKAFRSRPNYGQLFNEGEMSLPFQTLKKRAYHHFRVCSETAECEIKMFLQKNSDGTFSPVADNH